jgi:hypothetical protein
VVTGCEKTYVALFAEAEGFRHVHFHVTPRHADLDRGLRGPRVFGLLGGDVSQHVPDSVMGCRLTWWVRSVTTKPSWSWLPGATPRGREDHESGSADVVVEVVVALGVRRYSEGSGVEASGSSDVRGGKFAVGEGGLIHGDRSPAQGSPG